MIHKNIFFLGLLLLVPGIINAMHNYNDDNDNAADITKYFKDQYQTVNGIQENAYSTFSLKSHVIRPALYGATMISINNALDGDKKSWAVALTFSALNSAFELKSWKTVPNTKELKKFAQNTLVSTILTTIGVGGFKELRQNSYNLVTTDVSKMDIPKLTMACISLFAFKPCYNQFLHPLVKTMWNTPVNKLNFTI
jgi:hypothetical protein